MAISETSNDSSRVSSRRGSLLVLAQADLWGRISPERLAACLPGAAGGTVILTPPLVDLPDDDPLWSRTRAHAGPFVVVTGLHERAVRALFARRWETEGMPDDRRVCVLSFPDEAGEVEPDEILRRIREAATAHTPAGAAESASSWSVEDHTSGNDLPTRWYPVIDRDRCVRCGQCYEFCIFGVYEREANGVVRVVNPDACKPGCPACARVCPVQAIMFPRCQDDPVIAGALPAAGAESGDKALPTMETDSPGGRSRGCPRAADSLDDLIRRLDELDA